MKKISTNKAPKAIGPYSQAVIIEPFLFASGQIPVNPSTGCVVEGDITVQAVQVMENIKAVLEEAGYCFEDVIHFLRREMLDFTAFPVFFVSNLLLVQRKKYYFNRATVSRNCSIVL